MVHSSDLDVLSVFEVMCESAKTVVLWTRILEVGFAAHETLVLSHPL